MTGKVEKSAFPVFFCDRTFAACPSTGYGVVLPRLMRSILARWMTS